jgi:hypothetical protein
MKLFACQRCHQIVFFESVACTRCGATLAYLEDRRVLAAVQPLDPAAPPSEMRWTLLAPDATPGAGARAYRPCKNSVDFEVCNWAIPADSPPESPYCLPCRLNHVIPDLSDPDAKAAWRRLEIAKRRVVTTLRELGLPVEPRGEAHPHGLGFDFLKEEQGAKVFTGHDDGLITINIAEADDPFREKMRVQMGEAYRTLLGHFRHEIGHYYWDRLIEGSPALPGFRDQFGDERASYQEAQQRHYGGGPPADWPARYVSAYASMHPWEDWAETWAHYLHMFDTLQTARAYRLELRPRAAAQRPAPKVAAGRLDMRDFDELIDGWVPLTMAMNSLNRSMGLADPYPFVLSEVAIDKLRFVHQVVIGQRARSGGGQPQPQPVAGP